MDSPILSEWEETIRNLWLIYSEFNAKKYDFSGTGAKEKEKKESKKEEEKKSQPEKKREEKEEEVEAAYETTFEGYGSATRHPCSTHCAYTFYTHFVR